MQGLEKLECRYQTVKKCDGMSIRLDTAGAYSGIGQTERQTDGQTDKIGKTVLRSSCIAR